MDRYILIHYGEIGLKGANADYFIEKLRKHIRIRLTKRFGNDVRIRHSLRRFLVTVPDGFVEDDYVAVLSKIPGIKNFKFVYAGSADLATLGAEILGVMDGLDLSYVSSFCVKVKRSMELPFKSPEAQRELGAILLRSGFEHPVRLKGADFIVDVEFLNGFGYFSLKTYPGVGGMTSNTQGKLVSLLSSGIDSPVASYLMMKRGARVIFAHFHGYPYTDKSEMEQVVEIFEMLSEYQFDSKLYLVPFAEYQKEISRNTVIPSNVRTVLYRRLMLRIAQAIAKKEQARGLVTGDNFGQVASQTSENLYAIHDASSIPLYQPLIGLDKEDVIGVSEKIGTFEISKIPCKDSCTLFAPKVPELKADVYDVRDYEKLLPIDDWVLESLDASDVRFID